MNKKRTIVTALVIAASLVTPAVANAEPTYIGCAKGEGATPRVKPKSCDTWFFWISHAENFGRLRHLHWQHWGARQATATGRSYDTHFGKTTSSRVRLQAWRPRYLDRTFGRAYTRLTLLNPAFPNPSTHDGSYTMKMPWGFDLWPQY